MKKYFKLLYIAALSISVTSCLKDNELIGPEAPGAIDNVIEFGNPAAPISGVSSSIPAYSLSFDMEPTGVLNLQVKAVGAKPAKEDIHVKIALNNGLLDRYNEENEADYFPLPTEQYALETTEVVIKSGERVATIPLNLRPELFTFDHAYALGFTIESASSGEISGNFSNIVVAISGKNEYDGSYTLTTSANTSLVPNANRGVTLVTVGGHRVKLSPGLLGTYSNEVFYNIDPVTMAVTVECPSLGVEEPQDSRSKWDPSTKTLTVFWKQRGGGRTFEEVFTYNGPR